MSYEVVIGLEVHAQLKTKTKLFCRCENAFGRAPNSLTCPVCLALPGALPVTNATAVRYAAKAGLALGCSINPRSVFARKNYFYPDLPKGYQISQFDEPLCSEGTLEIGEGESKKTIRIQRIHMEEDAGKLLHGDNLLNKDGSLVDLNRAGVPLIEIVSHPELRSAPDAAEYLRKLRSILRYVDVCDGNMEEGSLRADANVSIRPVGQKEFGTKVEIKNMNSFKNVQKAIEYEVERQRQMLESGQKIVQETRLWNPDRGTTSSMRSKEEAHDYRYFPDPDLLPLELTSAWIEDVRSTLEELPDAKKARFVRELSLPEYDAGILTAEKEIAAYFEDALARFSPGATDPKKAKTVSNYVMGDLLAFCNERGVSIDRLSITPERLCGLLDLIEKGTISGKIAKDVLIEMLDDTASAAEIVSKKGLSQISDPEKIRAMIRDVLDKHPTQVADFRQGKEKILGFLVGQVMKAAKGQANPALLNELLLEELRRGV